MHRITRRDDTKRRQQQHGCKNIKQTRLDIHS
jgi:hypothetical protein